MPALNIFKNSAFSMFGMTSAINLVPNKYNRLRQLGIFQPEPTSMRTVGLESKNGIIKLIPSRPVGAPATVGAAPKRELRNFTVPHFPLEDVILAEDVQGVRAFGSESELMAVGDLVNDKLQVLSDSHEITREYLEWGALKGIVLDSDGSTLVNYFTEFGVTQKSISFDLSSTSTDVPSKIRELKRHMEENMLGETMSGVQVFVDAGFYDALIAHESIKEAYRYYASSQRLGEDYRTRFVHEGVVFEEQPGKAIDLAGNTRKFVPVDEGIAIPTGTRDTFRTAFAPAAFMETVNTRGLEKYAKQEVMKFDRGIEIWTESNMLPLVKRPALLVKLVAG